MSDGTPFLRVAADRIGAPGSPAKNAIPRHQRRQLVLNHPDRREDGRHSKANCTSSGFESHSTGWDGSIWGIPDYTNETGDRGPLAENAFGTLIPPEEVANIVTFLASGAARHATGTVIDINGASFPR